MEICEPHQSRISIWTCCPEPFEECISKLVGVLGKKRTGRWLKYKFIL